MGAVLAKRGGAADVAQSQELQGQNVQSQEVGDERRSIQPPCWTRRLMSQSIAPPCCLDRAPGPTITPRPTIPTQGVQGVRLYKFVTAGAQGEWRSMSNDAQPEFYDANEDSNKKKADWFLEIIPGNVDTRVDGALKYETSARDKRITLHAHGAIWALRFPSAEAARVFFQELEDKMFFNTFGFDNDEQGRSRALGSGRLFFGGAMGGNAVEPMELDPEPDTAGPEDEETGDYDEQELVKAGTPVHGIVMGATDNSYIMRGNQFDVLKNRIGGVEDAGISFAVTRPARRGTPAFTPTKVLMTNGERHMNILTPEHCSKLFRANIEYQKVVGEFSFMKDGVLANIDDITHENKHGQLDEGSTFLGLAANRLCRWDLRDPTGVVQQSPCVEYRGGKDYARNTNLTCMATSGDGYVVVGSRDGKVRGRAAAGGLLGCRVAGGLLGCRAAGLLQGCRAAGLRGCRLLGAWAVC
jgi:hypothetical protein